MHGKLELGDFEEMLTRATEAWAVIACAQDAASRIGTAGHIETALSVAEDILSAIKTDLEGWVKMASRHVEG